MILLHKNGFKPFLWTFAKFSIHHGWLFHLTLLVSSHYRTFRETHHTYGEYFQHQAPDSGEKF